MLPVVINSQTPELNYNNEFRLGIWQLFFGRMNLNYERYSKKGNSTAFIVEVVYNKNNEKETTGYMFELQPRINILNFNTDEYLDFTVQGIYVAPAIKYGYRNITDSDYNDEITKYGLNLILGIKFSMLSRLTLDICSGGGFTVSEIETQRTSNEYNNSVFSTGYSGISPVLNITFGFKF